MTDSFQSRVPAARNRLAEHGQQHLLRFAEKLNEIRLQELLADINLLDLTLIDELVERFAGAQTSPPLTEKIRPPAVYPVEPPAEWAPKYRKALRLGQKLIAEGKVAAFTVAGGMGTRLNFEGPKGLLPATPVCKKVLFQVFAEAIRATQQRYDCVIPWYIMTSSTNHETTGRAFEENNFFGLKADNVVLFQQGMMPCFDRDGKILLAEPHRLALSPDGHGGSLRALHQSGALEDMARRGVEHISYFQVDNPLVKVIDPLFIGLHALDQAEMSSKAVIKSDPLEKVGVLVRADDKMKVIEYSDLPAELAHQRNDNGRLTFELGSVAIHIINRTFVEKLNAHRFSLPWHQAHKRVGYVDENGRLIDPAQPNAVKLETFVFDALPLARESIILAIERTEEFAPIKNAAGIDSLQSSLKLQTERAARWLQKAGVPVPRRPDQILDAAIEISPLFALDADELARKRSLLPSIKPSDLIYIE